MNNDERCCGTGTCMIDTQGRCWCGQQWDGETMCRPGQGGALPYVSDAPGNLQVELQVEPQKVPRESKF